MSQPFHNEEFTFSQPDGSTFQVRGSGDQHHARPATRRRPRSDPPGLWPSTFGQNDVARLDVPVDDACLMSVPQPAGDLDGDLSGVFDR